MPSVLWRCWLGGRKGIRPVKNWVVGCCMVICLERGADLYMAQLMPLPLTVSCFSKIQIGFTFLVSAHPDSPGKRAVKRVCVSTFYLVPCGRLSWLISAFDCTLKCISYRVVSPQMDAKLCALIAFFRPGQWITNISWKFSFQWTINPASYSSLSNRKDANLRLKDCLLAAGLFPDPLVELMCSPNLLAAIGAYF